MGVGRARAMASTSRQDTAAAREAKLEEIAARLEAAVAELTTGEDWRRAMTFAAKFRSRSFGNVLLIYTQHTAAHAEGRVAEPDPTYVAGFQQWRLLGRSVDKGQRGYMIYAPVTRRFASATPGDPESWRRLARLEKPHAGEVVRSKVVNMRPAYVWDISQTSGEPLPERPRPRLLEGHAPDGLRDGLADQITAAGFVISTVPGAAELGGANAVTDFTARTVRVRDDMDAAAQVKSLAHERGHIALGHHDRGKDGLHRGIGEVEAESVAMMIAASYGMDSADYSVPYVSTWASTVDDIDPLEVVRATGELVRKTALAILADLPEPPVGDGRPPGLAAGTEPLPDQVVPAEHARPPRDALPRREQSRQLGVGM